MTRKSELLGYASSSNTYSQTFQMLPNHSGPPRPLCIKLQHNHYKARYIFTVYIFYHFYNIYFFQYTIFCLLLDFPHENISSMKARILFFYNYYIPIPRTLPETAGTQILLNKSLFCNSEEQRVMMYLRSPLATKVKPFTLHGDNRSWGDHPLKRRRLL